MTALALTGAGIALAYVRYELQLDAVGRVLDNGRPAGVPDKPGSTWPVEADALWVCGLLLFAATAVAFLAACWLAALA
ncbi:MAG TPA: hypothetical protein VFH03_25365 [Actinoplanes sp.]|nr:hypothetical protein [Actinoplanes sp.]